MLSRRVSDPPGRWARRETGDGRRRFVRLTANGYGGDTRGDARCLGTHLLRLDVRVALTSELALRKVGGGRRRFDWLTENG